MTAARSTIERIGEWCAQQGAATQDNAFGLETDVYRVGDKIFAMVNFEGDGFVTLKADPLEAEALRQQCDFVRPGYYMNKRHWITVDLNPSLNVDEIRGLIDDSYTLVLDSLTKAQREQIANQVSRKPPPEPG